MKETSIANSTTANPSHLGSPGGADIYKVLATVMDPEIPVLSLVDLGMITDVKIAEDKITVVMLPTFTACPAIKYMQNDIMQKMKVAGYTKVEVIIDTENKWTSDRVSEKGKKALENFGLGTPPMHHGNISGEMIAQSKCPHCGSTNTTLNSLFGSTLCRSIHFCFDCKQSFERFKPMG